jgi:SAM-dependent methyltransferase
MTDTRDLATLRAHYEVERELADRIRRAPAAERPGLYRTLYNELFRRVPGHPQNTWRENPEQQATRTAEQLRLLRPFLTKDSTYLEIGAGDCYLTRTVAREVKFAYGVDVSDVISASAERPGNFEQLLTDGTNLPVQDGTVTVAYSNMLVEHLHPDDFTQHLREVARVLAPGGVYVCRTPHRYTGPQDISQYFDREATGFHLKEYSYGELAGRFRAAGFGSVGVRPRVKGRPVPVPGWTMRGMEAALGLFPYRARKWLGQSAALRPLFATITVVGRKRG